MGGHFGWPPSWETACSLMHVHNAQPPPNADRAFICSGLFVTGESPAAGLPHIVLRTKYRALLMHFEVSPKDKAKAHMCTLRIGWQPSPWSVPNATAARCSRMDSRQWADGGIHHELQNDDHHAVVAGSVPFSPHAAKTQPSRPDSTTSTKCLSRGTDQVEYMAFRDRPCWCRANHLGRAKSRPRIQMMVAYEVQRPSTRVSANELGRPGNIHGCLEICRNCSACDYPAAE